MKYIIILFFIIISHWAQAQWHFTTKNVEVYDWVNNQWEYRNGKKNHTVKYEFNKEFTFFSLIEKKEKYIYRILYHEYDDEDGEDRFLCDILAEDNTEYYMIIDIKDNNIRFLSEKEGFCVLHNIKQMWKTKEEKTPSKKL